MEFYTKAINDCLELSLVSGSHFQSFETKLFELISTPSVYYLLVRTVVIYCHLMSVYFFSGFILNIFMAGIIYTSQQPDEVDTIVIPTLPMRK